MNISSWYKITYFLTRPAFVFMFCFCFNLFVLLATNHSLFPSKMARNSLKEDSSVSRNANSLSEGRSSIRNTKLSKRKKALELYVQGHPAASMQSLHVAAADVLMSKTDVIDQQHERSDKEDEEPASEKDDDASSGLSDFMCNNETLDEEDLVDTVLQNDDKVEEESMIETGDVNKNKNQQGNSVKLSPTYAGLARIHQLAMKSGVSLSFVDEVLGIVKSEGFAINECPLRSTYMKRIRNIDSINSGTDPALPTRVSVDDGRTSFPKFSLLSQLKDLINSSFSKTLITCRCPTIKTYQLYFKNSTAPTRIETWKCIALDGTTTRMRD
jgi:hypothetical protein